MGAQSERAERSVYQIASSMVDSWRLDRAREIPDTDLKELTILQETPLVVYGYVQGSAATSYLVLIDTANGKVGHTCPDYEKRGAWCKHIGKVLLKLSSDQITQVYNRSRTGGFRSLPRINLKPISIRSRTNVSSREDRCPTYNSQIE